MTDQLINNYKNYAETGLIIDTNGSIENAESTKGTLASKLGVGIDNISYNAEDGVFFVKSVGGGKH